LPEHLHRDLAPRLARVVDRSEVDPEHDRQPDQGRPRLEGADPMTLEATKAAEREGAAEPKRSAKAQLSEGAKAERRLGWTLCAPAVLVMVAVTAYPIGYAIYLSLERYDLRFPNASKFIGLDNYVAVLTSSYWWDALVRTLIITVVSVS